jgi:hypothetical protein
MRSQARLRELMREGVGNIWRSLPSYDGDSMDEWLRRVLPLVLAGQRQSALLTDAYLARAMERQPLGVDVAAVVGAAVRNGTSPEVVYQRPFHTVWAALGNGVPWADAVGAGLARAQSAAAMDVQLAMRATAAQVQRADPNIFGYQRAANANACEFCQEVAGAYVKEADAMPLHNNCGCDLEPLTGVHRLATHLPNGARVRNARGGPLISTPPPPTVAVHTHGELGPMLGAPGDNFTGPADLA